MVLYISMLCAVILAIAAGFHLYWGLGGRLGLAVSVPQREDGTPAFEPGAIATIAVGVVLAGVLVFVLALVGILGLPLPHLWIRVGIALWAVAFTARALSWYRYAGLFKSVRDTRFGRYDTWFYSPLCLVLGVGLLYAVVAVEPR